MWSAELPCADCGQEVPHDNIAGTRQPSGYDLCVCCQLPLCPQHHLKKLSGAFYLAVCQACYENCATTKLDQSDQHWSSLDSPSVAFTSLWTAYHRRFRHIAL
jgi:hypothetical protein